MAIMGDGRTFKRWVLVGGRESLGWALKGDWGTLAPFLCLSLPSPWGDWIYFATCSCPNVLSPVTLKERVFLCTEPGKIESLNKVFLFISWLSEILQWYWANTPLKYLVTFTWNYVLSYFVLLWISSPCCHHFYS